MNFDIVMPLVLFFVPLAAIFLAQRAEKKLKATLEDREFGKKDSALFIGMIITLFSVIIFVPDFTILVFFLFSYSSLLFIISYAFSNMKPKRLFPYCGTFVAASILAVIASLSGVLPAEWRLYGVLAFAGLAGYSLAALLVSLWKYDAKQKWYLAALSPLMFLFLFVFFNQTSLWFPFLLDVYGILFAMLIVIYIAPMFNWKIIFIFAFALTILDIILVWGPAHLMVQVATTLSGLNLPVLVWFPNFPPMFSFEGYLMFHGLGLGDLFFSGVLSYQTLKKFGKPTAIISLIAAAISFGCYELLLMNDSLAELLPVAALPATLPILTGWMIVIGIRMLMERGRTPKAEPPTPQQPEPLADSPPP